VVVQAFPHRLQAAFSDLNEPQSAHRLSDVSFTLPAAACSRLAFLALRALPLLRLNNKFVSGMNGYLYAPESTRACT